MVKTKFYCMMHWREQTETIFILSKVSPQQIWMANFIFFEMQKLKTGNSLENWQQKKNIKICGLAKCAPLVQWFLWRDRRRQEICVKTFLSLVLDCLVTDSVKCWHETALDMLTNTANEDHCNESLFVFDGKLKNLVFHPPAQKPSCCFHPHLWGSILVPHLKATNI